MKLKNFLLLIIEIKNIHEFNVLNFNLWIYSTKQSSIPCWHTLPCFHQNVICTHHVVKNNKRLEIIEDQEN
jgi:hypothetical protein